MTKKTHLEQLQPHQLLVVRGQATDALVGDLGARYDQRVHELAGGDQLAQGQVTEAIGRADVYFSLDR